MTKIYELQNHILIYTGYADPGMHRHMAAHIVISTEGEMMVTSDGKEYLCKGILIPSGVMHKIDTYGRPVLVFLYDNTTNIAKQIQEVKIIHEIKCEEIVVLFSEFEKNCTKSDYDKLEEYVLNQLHIEKIICNIEDVRILAAMKYIQDRGTEKITCKEVAETVFLSEGRFSHFADVNRRVFGISVSSISQDLQYKKVR